MIAAPRSTKIKGGERDPEMHQVKNNHELEKLSHTHSPSFYRLTHL